MRAAACLLAALLAAPAAGQAVGRQVAGYVRANPDGSEAETILVFRPDAGHVEVVKHRARCTSAAYVTAQIDPATRSTVAMSAGRLLPDARRREVGTITHDRARSALVLTLTTDDGERRETLPIPAGPWHLYDFDLASLSAVLADRPTSRATLAFTLPLAWNDGLPVLRDLGRVTLRYERDQRFGGRPARRFGATGGARFSGGPIWLDRRTGEVLGVRWGSPNHAEYSAFHLTRTATHSGGRATWRRLLTAHFAACPPR